MCGIRLVDMFHSCTEASIKDKIIKAFTSPLLPLCLVIAIVAFGPLTLWRLMKSRQSYLLNISKWFLLQLCTSFLRVHAHGSQDCIRKEVQQT